MDQRATLLQEILFKTPKYIYAKIQGYLNYTYFPHKSSQQNCAICYVCIMLRNHSMHLHTVHFGILNLLLVVLILHSEEKRVTTQLHLCKQQHCWVLLNSNSINMQKQIRPVQVSLRVKDEDEIRIKINTEKVKKCSCSRKLCQSSFSEL